MIYTIGVGGFSTLPGLLGYCTALMGLGLIP